ncbi:hypothetical protein [Devosia sp.]|uniref:hypothetical protein n=1 Tax=Devosia sp. TaxID=1871048 RepID=UPI003A951702
MTDEIAPEVTPPDGTKHGPVPPMQPGERHPDPGRKPIPNPKKPGDNPVLPPGQDPFPDNVVDD